MADAEFCPKCGTTIFRMTIRGEAVLIDAASEQVVPLNDDIRCGEVESAYLVHNCRRWYLVKERKAKAKKGRR